MIPAWHLAWIIPACVIVGGFIGVMCVALCMTGSDRRDH